MKNGFVIWFTGISGAGKTTLATLLKERSDLEGIENEFLDGDVVRQFFENDLGYTEKERYQNITRIAYAAELLSRHGIISIVANIAPHFKVREFIRRHIENYIQIYVDVSVETAIKRDVKGLYKKYKNGEMENLIGIDDRYDIPRLPNLILNTDDETPEQSFEKLIDYLKKEGRIS
ncbi:adenylyl-sulfate kinase [Candidatus Marinimicrobia bacterium MT.SAG.4]|nr:adenylyl-sulfate kinase [Candidatus Marinimicrobia bacterium MT.SAG.4]